MTSKYILILMTAAIFAATGLTAIYAQEAKTEKAAVVIESKCAGAHADCAAKCEKEKCICKDCATTGKCDPKCECCKEAKDGKCCGEGKTNCKDDKTNCKEKKADSTVKPAEKEKMTGFGKMPGCGGCSKK